MKQVLISEPGGVDRLQIVEADGPKPEKGELLIRVKASSINHLDIWVRRGLPKSPYPIIPGCDCSGVVETVGEGVRGFKKGDRVFVSPGYSCGECSYCLSGHDNMCRHYGIRGESSDGAQREFLVVKSNAVFTLPDAVSFEEAAAATLTYLTAWQMLISKGKVSYGQKVFIWGAGSGVGSAAIQLAKLYGATVYAAASTEEKRQRALGIGADAVIDSRSADVVQWVKGMTGKAGADLVVEHTGKDTISKSILMTKSGGTIVTCGATTGWDATIDLRHIFFRQLSLLGSTMGPKAVLPDIIELIAQWKLHPVIDSVYPMEQIREAHQRVETGRQFGKVVIQVG